MDAGPGIHDTVVLERDECLRLLAGSSFGRLAVSLGEAAPVIRPVNYVFDAPSQSVVFRTGEGSKFHALIRAARDVNDPERHSGWSVIILGAAREVTNPAEITRLERIGLDPYTPAGKGHWIQITARTVSGRRIGPA